MPKVPSMPCPKCGVSNDGATDLSNEGNKPKAGDFTICIKCGNIGIFTEDLHVRTAWTDEIDALDEVSKGELGKAMWAWRKMKESRGDRADG